MCGRWLGGGVLLRFRVGFRVGLNPTFAGCSKAGVMLTSIHHISQLAASVKGIMRGVL